MPPTTDPAVSVIVVTYNSADDIERCLRSVEDQSVAAEIIVVDNESPDGTAELVAQAFPDVTLVRSGENLGFAAGVNLGVAAASSPSVLLLNPDTAMAPGCIAALLDAQRRRPEAGILGGRTVDSSGNLEPSSCWGAPTLWADFCFAFGLSAVFRNSTLFDPRSLGTWQRDTERTVGVITGCLLFAARDVWDELGGMDETYWLYGEDTDFSVRAARAGYRPTIIPSAVIIHDIGASSASTGWRQARILQGQATHQRRLYGPVRSRIGLALLAAGVWLRAMPLLDILPGRRNASSVWKTAWNDRRTWWEGYRPGERPLP